VTTPPLLFAASPTHKAMNRPHAKTGAIEQNVIEELYSRFPANPA